MWRDRLRRLDERLPWLAGWVGGRLDIELPALLMSLGFHTLVLAALGLAGYKAGAEVHREFQARVVDSTLREPDLATLPYQDLDQRPEQTSPSSVAGSFAPDVATVTMAPAGPAPAAVARGQGGVALARLDVSRATEAVAPTASILGQTVAIRGSGAEHVGEVEGAVDRLADEILRRLELGRTLVAWAFDASGSLQAERQRLGKHIETVYTHVLQRDETNRAGDGGLLTMVLAFGQDRRALLPEPTADTHAVTSAIDAVPLDTTGVETTFGTVAEVVRRWGRYKDDQGHPYRLMVIVVTDEVGDDEARVEEAIGVARAARVPVYVLGSQALFGRVEGRMNYTDPKTKHTFYNVPVRQGPESVLLEQVRLPFWYGGPQYDALDAGFGPYALSRLAGATGGIYFVTRLGPGRISFDPVLMREYKPDWVSRGQYESAVARHPLRQAVLQAASITQQQLPGQPSLSFPPVDDPEFKEAMERNQAIAARTAYTVEAALEPINAAVRQRDRETSRRWQAHYELIRGRLLAMKIRCYEYNWACARLKKDAPKFHDPKSNAWKLVPDDQIRYNEKAVEAAQEARSLLERVVKDHPATPWALLAQRELRDSFGFKCVETYIRPMRRNDAAPAARKKKNAPQDAPKPAEPPKL